LEGEKKGYLKNGRVLAGNEKLRELSKRNQKGKTVRLTASQREHVKEAILKGAARAGEQVIALAVCSNHVHLVIRYTGKTIERTVRRLKNAGYFALRKAGFEGRVWTRGYDKRFCFDQRSLGERVSYVKGHGG